MITKPWYPRKTIASLVAVCLCGWTSLAPGGDVDPWEAPLSAEALDATSQIGAPPTAIVHRAPVETVPAGVVAPSVIAPTQAATPAPAPLPATAATIPSAVVTPAIAVTTDGRERSLVLAIPALPERAAEAVAPVLYVVTPLDQPAPYDFTAAAQTEVPEPLVMFEPPAAAQFEEVTVAALGALQEIVTPVPAVAVYPATLEDVPTAVTLHDLPEAVALPEPPEVLAVADPLTAALATTEAPVVLAAAPAAPAALPEPTREPSPQLLAKLDFDQRLPGPALSLAALAQISAFDPGRTVQRIEVAGKSPLSRPVMDDAVKAFMGTDRTDEQLSAVRDALQRAHDVNGHRVKVVVGEQRENDGVARLEVRELKRYSLSIAGEMRYDPVTRRNVRVVASVQHDEPLTSLTLSRKLSLR